MHQIILSILAIGLSGVVIYGGSQYVAERPFADEQMKMTLQQAFQALQGGFLGYRTANGAPPPEDDWEKALAPRYMNMPKAPEGLTWRYGVEDGHYFCLEGRFTQREYRVTRHLQTKLGDDVVYLARKCGSKEKEGAKGKEGVKEKEGAKDDEKIAKPDYTLPADLAATFWVSR
ncbi:MAG: hypothetical protein K2Q10_08640 [Rhodospirillales bacterium]|nr:hypothetical protein [Rhodospirillales bacterium]